MSFNRERNMTRLHAVDQARIDLCAALRQCHRFGYSEGIVNHFSYAVPDMEGYFLINPEGVHWSELRAADLLLIDVNGTVVEGAHKVEPTAFYIHGRIHRTKPDARCILHTHSLYATALAMLEEGRLEMASQSAVRFHERVAYDRHYNGLALDDEEGDRLVSCLGDKDVLFLANHGVIVCGPKISWAFDDLYFLERACQLQLLAQGSGQALLAVRPDVVAQAAAALTSARERALADLHFEALKRELSRLDPDWSRLDEPTRIGA
ncbi:aldolase [Thiomonas sp.]